MPIAQIEEIAGTHVPAGTLFPGIRRALRYYGVANAFTDAAPPAGWIMNPAGGRLIPPALFPSYLAASQGGCIVMADPVVPPPTPIEEPGNPNLRGQPRPRRRSAAARPRRDRERHPDPCRLRVLHLRDLPLDAAGRVGGGAHRDPSRAQAKVGPVELSGYLSDLFAAPPATPGGSGPAKAAVPYLLGLFPGSGTYFASVY